jgi:hypothetical protein
VRNLLLVEDDENQRASITALLSEEDVKIFGVGTDSSPSWEARICSISSEPPISGRPRSMIAQSNRPPVRASSLKDTRSSERLLDETALFLHRAINRVPVEEQILVERKDATSS